MRKFFLDLLQIYRAFGGILINALRLLGAPAFQCKYCLSCSEFARDEIKNNPLLISALARIFWRLLLCSPLKNKWTESLTRCVELPHNALPDLRKV